MSSIEDSVSEVSVFRGFWSYETISDLVWSPKCTETLARGCQTRLSSETLDYNYAGHIPVLVLGTILNRASLAERPNPKKGHI